MLKPDSLIFDMDGTLWDNVDTYADSWNMGLERTGHDKKVTRADILGLMGKEARVMLNSILPGSSTEEQDRLFVEVISAYQTLLGSMTPKIFDGMHEMLEKLSTRYKLLMLSNCEEGGLVNFMKFTKTSHLFADYAEHGQNLKPKSYNLRMLIERNNLQQPMYIGDTDSDSREATKAGVPFVFVTFGFGETENYALRFDSLPELADYFMNL